MAVFLLEVGTEELPASFVGEAIAQWQAAIPTSLSEQFLSPDDISVYATPRRISVLISGLPDKQDDREEEVKGPPAKAAFRDGEPTKAAEGFARKQGVDVKDLEVRPTPKGDFVFVLKKTAGRKTAEILTELIPGWISGLDGKRFMRWGEGEMRFSRPIRWLVMLMDKKVLPLTIDNQDVQIVSDRTSRGHRVLHPEPITIKSANDYVEAMRKAFVMVDPAERLKVLTEQTEAAAKKLKGDAEMPEDLVAEVTNLIEWPTAVVGTFEDSYLSLPPEVITEVMISHQRYFPLRVKGAADSATAIDAKKTLLPKFVTISNGDPAKSEIIAEGNARVVRARMADGEYFYKSDAEQSLESFLPKLDTVTFQADLGSMSAKVERIEAITGFVADQLGLKKQAKTNAMRAAKLCKADLMTQMVYEFPELQGVMGQKYALVDGEEADVAAAMVEHYLPKGAGDSMPKTQTGQVVGIADRLDTLVSIFGLGQIPSGSSDPFALRRAAQGIVNIVWDGELKLNLNGLIEQSVAQFAKGFGELMKSKETSAEKLVQQLRDFFLQRVRTLLQEDQGIDYDLVNAVVGDGDADYAQRALEDLLDVGDRARFLQAIRDDKRLDAIYPTVNRSAKLAVKGDLDTAQLDPKGLVNAKLFEQSSEGEFLKGLEALLPKTESARASRDYSQLVAALTEIAPTVSEFFDGDNSVMVMAEDAAVKTNRLNLLGLLRNHARVLADFGAIVKPG